MIPMKSSLLALRRILGISFEGIMKPIAQLPIGSCRLSSSLPRGLFVEQRGHIISTKFNQSNFNFNRANASTAADTIEEGFINRLRRKLGYPKLDISRTLLKRSGTLIYVEAIDVIDIKNFFAVCALEDTFTSWFAIMELHVWLLCSRLMENGTEGRLVRNAMLRAMWKDVDVRSKKLEGALAKARRLQIKELGEQFNTQLISYDEGHTHGDKLLAGALWRRFLQHRTPQSDAELVSVLQALEMLVAYTRSQFAILHATSRHDLILERKIQWGPFDKSILNS